LAAAFLASHLKTTLQYTLARASVAAA